MRRLEHVPDDAEFRCVCSARECLCDEERGGHGGNWCPRVAVVVLVSPSSGWPHRMCLPCAEHAITHRGYREANDKEASDA